MSQDHRVGGNKGARGGIAPRHFWHYYYKQNILPQLTFYLPPWRGSKSPEDGFSSSLFLPPHFLTFRRPCTIDFYDDNNSSAAKDDSNTAGGAQSLQRMDSAPAFFFLLFKLLGKVFRTMTITKGLWGRATLTMDQKFEIGTPLMRNFLFFSFPSFFFFLFFTVILS